MIGLNPSRSLNFEDFACALQPCRHALALSEMAVTLSGEKKVGKKFGRGKI